MLPPIPSPTAHDCPNCATIIDDAKIKYCPNCGAALKRPRTKLSEWSIAGILLLSLFSLGTGSCAITVLRELPYTADYFREPSQFFANATLVFSALGVVGIILLLRPLWRR